MNDQLDPDQSKELAGQLSTSLAALDAAVNAAARAEASKARRYEWYRSAPGISSRAHDIVKWEEIDAE